MHRGREDFLTLRLQDAIARQLLEMTSVGPISP